MQRALSITAAIATLAAAVGVASQPPQPPQGATAAQQRPVFRGGTHFVRVDAYPIKDGKIIEDLTAEDFEILEDGKPQKVESLDFVRFDTFTPEVVRRDPSSQREGFDMAADPRYRVFVIFVDMVFGGKTDLHYIQQPLVQFLDRILGPQDLYGFFTSRNSVKDLVLAQKSTVIQAQILDLFRSANIDRDDADQLIGCGCGRAGGPQCDALLKAIQARHRADATYTALEGLVLQLGSIRQERKNVVFVSNQLPRWRPDTSVLSARGPTLPKIGVTNGRIGIGDSNTGANESYCASEFQRLANMDFDTRYQQLLHDARQQNVSFYPVTPAGLQAPTTIGQIRAVQAATDDLIALAHETDGLAIVNTNDLSGGMKKIADDLAAYYILGYYTTNTKWDGGLRAIKVRLTRSGVPVRARRQYRAPTEAEIAALARGAAGTSSSVSAASAKPSARETALIALERASRPFAVYAAVAGKQLTAVAELSAASIQVGRWKEGADVEVVATGADGTPVATARGKIEAGSYATAIRIPLDAGVRPARVAIRLRSGSEPQADDWIKLDPSSSALVGDPLVYRAGSRIAPRPVAAFEFARNERIRVEWPVLATLDRREVRLLDRTGRPLPVEIPLAEDPTTHAVVVEMSVSGLGRGDYLIELTAGAGAVAEKHLIALRIK
jgi:VWFA-related protein